MRYQNSIKPKWFFFSDHKNGLWFKSKKKKNYAHFKLNQFFFSLIESGGRKCFFFCVTVKRIQSFWICYASMCLIVCLLLGMNWVNKQVKERIEINECKHNLCHTINRFVYTGCSTNIVRTRGHQNKAHHYWRWDLMIHTTTVYLLKNVLRTSILILKTHTSKQQHPENYIIKTWLNSIVIF